MSLALAGLLGALGLFVVLAPFLFWALRPAPVADLGEAAATDPRCACGWYDLSNYEQIVLEPTRTHTFTKCTCTPQREDSQ